MQSLTRSVHSPFHDRGWEALLARAVRHCTCLAMAELPAIRWAEMKPVDFEREDTTLTQEQLERIR